MIVLLSSRALLTDRSTTLAPCTMSGRAKRSLMSGQAAAAPKRPCLEMRERRMLALLVQTCNEVNSQIKDPKKHVPIRFDMGATGRSEDEPLRPCAICATQLSKVHITAVAQCGTCYKHVCGDCEKGHFCRSPGVQHVSDVSTGDTSDSDSDSDSMSIE